MRRAIFPLMLAAALLVPLRADALTLRDVIELTRAGLGEDVLLALIEVDRPVFGTDPATIKLLKEAGVSERVIIAMIRSGREPIEPAQPMAWEAPPQPEPQVIVIDHHEEQPRVREVPVAVPVPIYVPIVPTSQRTHDRERVAGRPNEPIEPVYWGFGGKRRPDAWQEDPRTIRLREELRKGKKDDRR